jgi:hypothetical protein
MKINTKFLILLNICLIVTFLPIKATEILVSADKIKVNVIVGTTTAYTGVAFDIVLKDAMTENVKIDVEKFFSERVNLPKFEIRDTDDKVSFELHHDKIGAALYKIQMADNKPEIIEALSNRQNYIFINAPIRVALTNGDYLIINPDVLKKATLEKVYLSEENKNRLIAARGGTHTLYQNKIDITMQGDAADSSKKIFLLDFSFLGTPLENIEWWKFATKGCISTDKNDPISEIQIFPLTVGQVYGLQKGKPFETGEIRFYFGVEGNQTFKKSRLNGSFYYTTMLPNIIDLTFGSKDRLRLFPVVKIGAEYWDEIKDEIDNNELKRGGKIGGEIYYYIPIMKKYSLLVEGNFGFTFGKEFKEKNNVNGFISKFDFTLGYEIPGADLKVLVTYSFGQNDINFIEDTRLLLGLAIDLFSSINL